MGEQRGGWVYRTFRWREGDGDAKAWRRQLADDGWEESEYGVGEWSVIDGQRGFGVTVRRWMERPGATPPR
ncbi:hypothetical protein G7075_04215 [Phycicoccus sp. HDW14]|uniref:hypothetical protein n=1 Tax=Phycicoccus sp. HDW14 TaxID=2714941 RepID=UPI0014075E70|nr:hypothetical protein [Phycicoccus sp. HDW14]QIM20524.1 hypothetical protein G7075_04215 [Phycicoccus sp. HDW14]